MGERPDPLFLERGSYRQRRMLDAVRLIAFLGALLWMIPLFWASDEGTTQSVPMSSALLYIFGVWTLLIAISAVLSFRMRLPHDGARGLAEEDPLS